MHTTDNQLPAPADKGTLGVFRVKRIWARILAERQGNALQPNDDWELDHLVINALGLGLEQTMKYLMLNAPSFEEFERWIVDTTGGVPPKTVARINATMNGEEHPEETRRFLDDVNKSSPVLSEEDLAFWEEHGYVILHDAVPEESCRNAEQAIWEYIGATPADPETWYREFDHGIMLQFYQHPAFSANRNSHRIHKAFAQLWRTADLWVSTDRVGFNPPEQPGRLFQGPDMHWDISLKRPLPLHLQGILYLTDTPTEQGAFTCVPGFHRRIDAWLDSLPPNTNPRQEDMHALGSRHIAGHAGDLIIWDDRLPHGSSPNRGTRPRIVQYIRMYPAHLKLQREWI